MAKDRVYPTPGWMTYFNVDFVPNICTMNKCATYLVHNVNEDLRIIPRKATDRVIDILTRKDCLNQGGELIWDKLASDQTSYSWSVEKENRVAVTTP